jgi:Ca-activated chloride channel family protein
MLLFAASKYLYLLLLVPLIPLLYGLLRWLRSRRVQAFGDPALVEALMPSRSRSKGWVRVSLLSLALAFFILGLARPQTGAKLSEHRARGAEIIVALDVSNSMLAQDYSPNRLERAKLSIARLTEKLQDDRIGLVLFAGTSFVQLPVTTDYVSAKMFLGNIDTGSIPVQGTAIGDAIRLSIKSFSAQSEKSRVIIVISDGENHEDDPVEAAAQAAELGIKVYTIGVGSAEGQPIPQPDGSGLLRDKDGEIVVTKLDEATLRAVAKAGGGAYIHAGGEEFGLNPIVDDIRRMEDEEFGSVVFEEYDEQYMYFLAVALLLLVIEMLIGERKPRRKLFEV